LLLKLNAGTTAAALQEPTLGAVIEVYTRDEMPARAKSQQNYRLLMDRHIRPKWGDKVPSEVRPHTVEVWLRELSYSPETKRHIKSKMYRLFELAMKRGWLEAQRNPMSLVRVKGRNRVIEKVVLTPDQMLSVRENLEDPYLMMAELACYLGLRICEVLGLMWDDFDEKAKTLSIRRSAVDGVVADVKSEASRDVIPLNDDFISLLTRWQKIAPTSEEGWMFPSIVTGRPYHAGILLRRHLQPLAAKVGVPRLGWHTFRHTFRSWLDAVGTAVGVQQKMMRHADVTTTMNVYGKGMMDTKLEAHTKLLEYARVGFSGVEAGPALELSY
jgi:integrase